MRSKVQFGTTKSAGRTGASGRLARGLGVALVVTTLTTSCDVLGVAQTLGLTDKAASSARPTEDRPVDVVTTTQVPTTTVVPETTTTIAPTTTVAPITTTTTPPTTVATPTTVPVETATTQSAGRVDCAVAKCIALTFDDGPSKHTPRLLDHLAAKKAKATFFVVGQQVTTRPETARQIVQSGNEIGVHTWSHPSLTKVSRAEVSSQISRTANVIKQTTGVQPTVFRPPYGATNATVRAVAGSAGVAEILWSVDTNDWKNRDASIVTQRVLAKARPGGIVLMHDVRPTSVDAMPAIIDGLTRQGYHLVTVSELLGSPQAGQTYSARR